MKQLLSILIALTLSFACECESEPFSEAVSNFDVIFTGTVDSVSQFSDETSLFANNHFSTHTVWKGDLPETVEVTTSLSGCGLTIMTPNRNYLVFANYQADGTLFTRFKCSYTSQIPRDTEFRNPFVLLLENKFEDSTHFTSNDLSAVEVGFLVERLRSNEQNLELQFCEEAEENCSELWQSQNREMYELLSFPSNGPAVMFILWAEQVSREEFFTKTSWYTPMTIWTLPFNFVVEQDLRSDVVITTAPFNSIEDVMAVIGAMG